MVKSNEYITNINKSLKGIKSDISANYIWSVNRGIVITTNRVVAELNMKVVKKYMKNLNDVDLTEVLNSRLSQSKSYLRILDISYFIKDTNLSILSDIINSVIKSTHIFDNIVLSLLLWTKTLGWGNRTTLVLSNTRELDRVPSTK